MLHVSQAWKRSDELTLELAATYPQAIFTCVRDLYGRISLYIENSNDEDSTKIREIIQSDEGIRPFLAVSAVNAPVPESPLLRAVRGLRKPFENRTNAYYVERLLFNESWNRTDENPKPWPPVIAFYSFKGGVGRTTTAALTALTLAREGKRVVLLDLDLEAPGIEGFFFGPDDSGGEIRAGVVDYILEKQLIAEYQPNMDDFVLPVSDRAIAAAGGSLLIVPAGRLDDTYMERLGRLNLADIGRQPAQANPIRGLIGDVLKWRSADLVLVDCRTGFTDLGGITLNGLSNLDVLVFRGGESDRRYLPLVLGHIRRFRESPTLLPEVAERLARSFLVAFTMVEFPARSDDAAQYIAELRRYTSEICWKQIFERFSGSGYAYPGDNAIDSPVEPVPHDVVMIPYMKDFFALNSAFDMLHLQAERPDQPYDALVRRITDVKLAPLAAPASATERSDSAKPTSLREKALEAIKNIAGSPAGEREFSSAEDFRRWFLPRAAHRTLLDPQAFLILGRKGAGKSALFQLLRHEKYLRALSQHVGIDSDLVTKTRWDVGFSVEPGFPRSDDFTRVLEQIHGDPDQLSNYWRALAALRLSQMFNQQIPGLASFDDCANTLRDSNIQRTLRDWLTQLNSELQANQQFCCLSYDDLDTGLTRDSNKRKQLVSALVDYWQQAPKYMPRIRAKIFLREDIWNNEVRVTDKAKVRDTIDRATITWEGPDIYRTILKRLGSDPTIQTILRQAGLWIPEFDRMIQEPLGFIPPNDQDWIQKCIHLIAGETMAAGPSGFKKGYVYTWVLNHVSDGSGVLRPRNALLLFSEAARWQGQPTGQGPILAPRSFVKALRGEVSRKAIEDLRVEFDEDWTVDGVWMPDEFAAFAYVWPVIEEDLVQFLKKEPSLGERAVREMLAHMVEVGLLERRIVRGREPQLQVPDIYLFGLNLTRKG